MRFLERHSATTRTLLIPSIALFLAVLGFEAAGGIGWQPHQESSVPTVWQGAWYPSGLGTNVSCNDPNDICAEWITQTGERPFRPCCIDAGDVGSTQLSACPQLKRDYE